MTHITSDIDTVANIYAPNYISTHIGQVLHHHIDHTAYNELLNLISVNNGRILVPKSLDLHEQLVAYFSQSLSENRPLKRVSNLILVTDNADKRIEALQALEMILPALFQLGYVDKIPEYAIRYPDNQYFCSWRFRQITRLENSDTPNRKALIAEARAYSNRFLLSGCSDKLRNKICVKKCILHCPDASNCGYKVFLNNLKAGAFPLQIYSPQQYIRNLLRQQAGKRSRLPVHNTVMFLDNMDELTSIVQAAGSQSFHCQKFYTFLLDCERLCGTKKVYKASVRTFTAKLRQRFDDFLLLVVHDEPKASCKSLLMELSTGMEILQQKCKLLFQDNRRMFAIYSELSYCLETLLAEYPSIQYNSSEKILILPRKITFDDFLLQIISQGVRSMWIQS